MGKGPCGEGPNRRFHTVAGVGEGIWVCYLAVAFPSLLFNSKIPCGF